MSKLSKRLKTITTFVDKNDNVVDVGCDHGLLSIYLKENNLVNKVIASDVNINALSSAIKNIELANLDIETVLSDGIDNVNMQDINTLIIAGMGTGTIKHILEDSKKIEKVTKLVIQSNNDHEILRQFMNDIGYYLEDEVYVFDKGKWYVTSLFIKSDKKNSSGIIKYGFLNNNEYNKYLLDSREEVLRKIPVNSKEVRNLKLKEINELKEAICK